MRPKDLFISAAEASGDVLGGLLLDSLLKKKPDLLIEGIAGPLMREHLKDPFLHAESFYVMGFLDVMKALLKLIKLYKLLLHHLLKNPPKILILIDYPGLHLRLAKDLKKRGFPSPIIQYVCPSVWAWKKNRIKTMQSSLDALFCLFPFEPSCFTSTLLPAYYVGHPLVEKALECSKPKNSHHFLICPGSRLTVVKRNFPLQLKSALEIKNLYPQHPLSVLCSSEKIKTYIKSILDKENVCCILYDANEKKKAFDEAFFSFASSGTITLELALAKIPTVVSYKVTLFDAFLAKAVFRIKLPFYCIVNILCHKEIFPEHFGPFISSSSISYAALDLLKKRNQLKENLDHLIKVFKENPTCASDVILSHLRLSEQTPLY